MRIALIEDKDVINVVGNVQHGKPTDYIRSLLSYNYPTLDTASVRRKLKDMEARGLVKRVNSPVFLNNISWQVIE